MGTGSRLPCDGQHASSPPDPGPRTAFRRRLRRQRRGWVRASPGPPAHQRRALPPVRLRPGARRLPGAERAGRRRHRGRDRAPCPAAGRPASGGRGRTGSTPHVSAGDETQGALPQIAFATTSPDFAFMRTLGYDVMCPGNHEFDQGPDAYAAAITRPPTSVGCRPSCRATSTSIPMTRQTTTSRRCTATRLRRADPAVRILETDPASGRVLRRHGFVGFVLCAAQDAGAFSPRTRPTRATRTS
jgi:hypothetical protein